MINVNDRVVYNDDNLHGRIIKIVSKDDKDEFHVKVKKNDKEKILKLNADEFTRIADTYDPLKKRAFESRADMFMRKYRGDVLGCLDAKMIVQRTETAILMALAVGALSEQHKVCIFLITVLYSAKD